MAARLTPEQREDREMSEEKLRQRVIYRAKKYGWRHAHAGRGTNPQGFVTTPMAKGWPDETFAKAGHRLIFAELKRELGHLTDEQVEWLTLLARTGNRAILIRPSDLREGRVDAMFRDGSPL